MILEVYAKCNLYAVMHPIYSLSFIASEIVSAELQQSSKFSKHSFTERFGREASLDENTNTSSAFYY